MSTERHWIYTFVTAETNPTPSRIVTEGRQFGLDLRQELIALLADSTLVLKRDGTVGHRVLTETDYVRFYKRIDLLTVNGKRDLLLKRESPTKYIATCKWTETVREDYDDAFFHIEGVGHTPIEAVADLYHQMVENNHLSTSLYKDA